MTLLDAVHERLRSDAIAASDPAVTVGEHVILVAVTHPEHGRIGGLAHRPPGDEGRLETQTVESLAASAIDATSRLQRAAGIATLNALSVPHVDWRSGDPMAAVTADVDVVATVGLFRPALRKFSDVTVRVVEREPPDAVDAPPGVTVETYPPADCAAAFADADVCFVTGSTLVYGGIDRYLTALSTADVTPVVLVGATASHVPAPAFAAGVDVVAGARVTSIEQVRPRVRAGDCGTDLHTQGVAKVYVSATAAPVGLDLPRQTHYSNP